MSFVQALPVIAPLSRAIEKDHTTFYYLLVILLTLLVLATKTWGLVVLTLAFVPVIFLFLVVIARP